MSRDRSKTFILFLLISAIFYLGHTNQLMYLINPRNFYFVFISLIIIFIFLLFSILVPQQKKSKGIESSYILVLIITGLLFSTDYKEFQENLVKNRDVTLDSLNYNPFMLEETLLNEFALLDHIEITSTNYLEITDYFYSFPRVFTDKSITVSGFVYYEEIIKDNYFIVARLLMLCCAADAQIYGLLVENPDNIDLEPNSWIQINGTIKYRDVTIGEYTKKYPIIVLNSYIHIPEPLDPYIYISNLN